MKSFDQRIVDLVLDEYFNNDTAMPDIVRYYKKHLTAEEIE